MKPKLFSIFSVIVILFYGCRKEVVSVKPYGQSILESTVYYGVPQLQSKDELKTLKENSVKSMSFIKEYIDSSRLDSLTYLEFDRAGKLLQRTTTEVTTVGCLPQMIRQIFHYEGDRIKRVDNYTFKYVTNSVFEKWMENDTTRLNKFDWEDYSYSGDTIIVESGFAVWKFVKDENGKMAYNNLVIKTNNQKAERKYNYNPSGLVIDIKNTAYDSKIESRKEYLVELNKVLIDNAQSRVENVYDAEGLLNSIDYYKYDKLFAKTRVYYDYYK